MPTPYRDRPLPAPIVDAATAPYWEAAKAGRLLLRRCVACARPHWYPRPTCPFCLGDTEWIEAAGTGTVYSVSVSRRMGPVPYAIAYVTLDEGVTMLTGIVDCDDLDAVRIGDRVRVVFKPAEDGGAVPMFAPSP